MQVKKYELTINGERATKAQTAEWVEKGLNLTPKGKEVFFFSEWNNSISKSLYRSVEDLVPQPEGYKIEVESHEIWQGVNKGCSYPTRFEKRKDWY